ncbi:MAG: hypothetical protein WB812_00810 [Woeseiaceae bacterium]
MKADRIARLSIEKFEAGNVDVDAFDHEAHVYIAWLYLKTFPRAQAAARFCAALRRLTERVGVPARYHETISRFFLELIARRRDTAAARDWPAFRRENDDLCSGAAELLQRHYSPELLSSERARTSFVMPDRRVEQTALRTGLRSRPDR